MGDGSALVEHEASAQRQWEILGRKKKRPVEEDDGPVCPRELVYLWNFFWEISDGISPGGFGPAVVTWNDLYCWRAQMGIDLAPWETRAIVRLGNLRAVVASEKTPTPAS